jgi:hypothetical protein
MRCTLGSRRWVRTNEGCGAGAVFVRCVVGLDFVVACDYVFLRKL